MDTKKEFLETIYAFIKHNKIWGNCKVVRQLQHMFLEYMANNPDDTEILMKFALLSYQSMLHNDLDADACLKKILMYEPDNIYAILISVYINLHLYYINDSIFQTLLNLPQHHDPKIMSMIEFARAWYYEVHGRMQEYEQALVRSIECYNGYLKNYMELGRLYIKQGRIVEGQLLMKQGLKNLEYVYNNDNNSNPDVFDIEDFFKERFQGVRLSKPNYKMVLESFHPNSIWIHGGKVVENKDGTTSIKTQDGKDPDNIYIES